MGLVRGLALISFLSGLLSRKASMFSTVVDAMLASASCVRKAECGVTITCRTACYNAFL